jgi:Exocyst complex component Sec10
MNGMTKKIRDSLDGKNVDSFLTELGVRFHRVIFEHLQQFQFNSAGNYKNVSGFNLLIRIFIRCNVCDLRCQRVQEMC